jgi:hypothetical protein
MVDINYNCYLNYFDVDFDFDFGFDYLINSFDFVAVEYYYNLYIDLY